MSVSRINTGLGSIAALLLSAALLLTGPAPAFAQQGKWTRVDSVFATGFWSVSCADENNCLAIGIDVLDKSIVRQTTDGGKTWRTVFQDVQQSNPHRYAIRFYDVAHPTPDLCIVACDSGAVIRSTDGGKNWTRFNPGAVDTARLFNLAMLDENNGVMLDADVGTYRYFRTTDGGATWRAFPMPKPDGMAVPSMYRLVYPMPFTIIGFIRDFDTHNCVTVRSTDDGKTWQTFPAPDGIGRGALFLDGDEGWAIAPGGTVDFPRDIIYHTTNGGETWDKQLDTLDSAAPTGLNDIDFADPLNGLAVGDLGKIYRTTDAGQHWIREASELTYSNGPSFQGVAFWTTGTQIAIDRYNGTIYRYEAPAGAVDRGAIPETNAALYAYPNPLHNGGTLNITFRLAASGNTRMSIVNAMGKEVTELFSGAMDKGPHTVQWVPGADIPNGGYFVRLLSGGATQTLPFVLAR